MGELADRLDDTHPPAYDYDLLDDYEFDEFEFDPDVEY